MSIRSYKQIYEKFQSMFPELAKMTSGFKGVRFSEKRICIFMNDGSSIDFRYVREDKWILWRYPKEEKA